MESFNAADLILKLGILLFSVSLHEVGHGWMAWKLGDPTAKMLGRLTLDPRRHVDPVGSLLVPGVLYLFGGPILGWAKPVPVTKENLRNPRRDDILVSFMGPAMNLLLFAVGFAALFVLVRTGALGGLGDGVGVVFQFFAFWMLLNLVLAFFNLLPIPPLDGSWILRAVVPGPVAYQISRLEPFGFLILFGALYLGLLNPLWGFVQGVFTVSLGIIGL